VHERHHEQIPDPQLSKLLPDSVSVVKTGAIPATLTRLAGVGDIGVRAYWHLKRAISALLENGSVDLLFITTSPYYNALAGPRLKKKFKVPLVVDFQDPWVSQWGKSLAKLSKGGLSHRLGTWLEPRVIRFADHVTSVSEGTNEEIRARYPALPEDALSALPIGGERRDFEALRCNSIRFAGESENREGEFHFSYVGTIWPRSHPTVRAVLTALARIRSEFPDLYAKMRLNFIGTSAQSGESNKFSILPHAAELGVAERVTEIPQRLDYLEALKKLTCANAILVIGSDEPHYSASKLHPSFLAGPPLLAIVHEQSSVCEMVRRVGGAALVTFSEREDFSNLARSISEAMVGIVRNPDRLPRLDSDELAPMSAEFMTQRYAALFDRVLAAGCRQPWW
jgi:glycosyltransferase involved in cell wall biosynthesis